MECFSNCLFNPEPMPTINRHKLQPSTQGRNINTNMSSLRSTTSLFVLLLLIPACLGAKSSYYPPPPKGRRCIGHKVKKLEDFPSDFKPEIIRSWNYHQSEPKKMVFHDSFYQPRYKEHTYVPIDDTNLDLEHTSERIDDTNLDLEHTSEPVDDAKPSSKYANLDLFVTMSGKNPPDDFVTLHFQRPARVYLMVPRNFKAFEQEKEAVLPGWKAEGWAELNSGCAEEHYEFGVVKPLSSPLKVKFSKQVYVFSNAGKESDEVTLPSFKFVAKEVADVKWRGMYNTLVAEENGAFVEQAKKPPSFPDIPAGGRCPDELHDTWYTEGDDTDEHTPLGGYRTYHPLWDPCYWCSYDHEHGSDPKELMDYDPKFGYTALKNGAFEDGVYKGQDESHNGFKGMVLELEDNKFMYFQVHALLSDLRRYNARTHTMVIVVKEKIGGEFKKLMELSFKADFGFATAKKKGGGNEPITEEDKKMKDAGVSPFRILNVVDVDNLDPAFRYKNPALKGQNEHWFTLPMCASSPRRIRATKLEIRDPATGVRSRYSQELVVLGKTSRDDKKLVVQQNPSMNRDFTAEKVEFSPHHCGPWYFDEIGDAPEAGVFYTNPTGELLVEGPAEQAIKQYIDEDFTLYLDGKWKAVDTWVGLHRLGWKKGHMRNVGFGIEPMHN